MDVSHNKQKSPCHSDTYTDSNSPKTELSQDEPYAAADQGDESKPENFEEFCQVFDIFGELLFLRYNRLFARYARFMTESRIVILECTQRGREQKRLRTLSLLEKSCTTVAEAQE